MRDLLALLLVSALASSCAPSDYQSCLMDASSRPTDQGVRLAKSLCYDKFEEPRLKREKQTAQLDLQKFREDWKKAVGGNPNEASLLAKFGEPADRKDVVCHVFDGVAELTPERCISLTWALNGPACSTSPPAPGCLQNVQINTATGEIWAHSIQ